MKLLTAISSAYHVKAKSKAKNGVESKDANKDNIAEAGSKANHQRTKLTMKDPTGSTVGKAAETQENCADGKQVMLPWRPRFLCKSLGRTEIARLHIVALSPAELYLY